MKSKTVNHKTISTGQGNGACVALTLADAFQIQLEDKLIPDQGARDAAAGARDACHLVQACPVAITISKLIRDKSTGGNCARQSFTFYSALLTRAEIGMLV